MCSFLKNLRTVLHSDFTGLPSHQQTTGALVPPHAHQHQIGFLEKAAKIRIARRLWLFVGAPGFHGLGAPKRFESA